jgi:amidase
MGDANYYTALLEQYYYGSNASELQWLISCTWYHKRRSDPRCFGKIRPRCTDHSKLNVTRLCRHCRVPHRHCPAWLLSSQHERHLQLTRHTCIPGTKLPVRRRVLDIRHQILISIIYFSFGLSFYGRRFSEASLVKYACAFESATNVCSELFSRHPELTDGLLVPAAAKPIRHP